MPPLTPAMVRELRSLEARYGAPAVTRAEVEPRFLDPMQRRDRIGEVCMVVRRPTGGVIVSTKAFYPAGVYRLPTGGIDAGEGIEAALVRETREETGLDVVISRSLASITYDAPSEPDVFHTFAFLLEETGGTLGALDMHEQITDQREVAIDELPVLAAHLASLADGPDVDWSWSGWGRFRAVVHRVVHAALVAG